jgi:hypothetical protein
MPRSFTRASDHILAVINSPTRDGGSTSAWRRRSMKRRLILGLLVFAIACSDDDIAGAATTTGAYTLRTVNGSSLPYNITTGTAAGTVIVDDVITLYQGGTFAGTRHTRSTANGPIQTTNETGAYTLFGTSISFRVNETGLTKVAIGDGSRLTFVEQGVTMLYIK